jgi:acetyl esterase
MAKEHWYFVCGVLLVLVPLVALVAVKKLRLLEARPAEKIVYTHSGEQALFLHAFPAQDGGNSPAPALLLFHGGGWLFGEPRDLYPQCQFFAAAGFTCFSAQYHLGANYQPDVRKAMATARAALDYLITHASELHIDPLRIVVGGGSAGGHLAAALGSGLPLTSGAKSTGAHRPAAQILYNPALDLSPGTPEHHLVKEYWEDVSPYHHIDSETPRALILVGTQDVEVPISTTQSFCAAMLDAGVDCEIAQYEGQGHGFFHNPEYRDKTNERILEFLAVLR